MKHQSLDAFDSDLLKLMEAALDAAATYASPANDELRMALARRIVSAAAADGNRDLVQLARAALEMEENRLPMPHRYSA